jgi:hypothetical protein
VLVELKQAAPSTLNLQSFNLQSSIQRYPLGDLELVSLFDGFFRLDGGAMFGVVPKPLWSAKTAPDERNRILLAMRPLLVRGARTMIIDAASATKKARSFRGSTGSTAQDIWITRWQRAGLAAEQIDIGARHASAFRSCGRFHDA